MRPRPRRRLCASTPRCSSLLKGWPKLTPPASAKAKRIFQLRTYESPSYGAHVRKVEMFHKGEFEIFTKAGCRPVFFADTLAGPRMPNLTYMLSFTDIDELNAGWAKFVRRSGLEDAFRFAALQL